MRSPSLIALAIVVAGCGTTGGELGSATARDAGDYVPATGPDADTGLDTSALGIYIQLMRRLVDEDAAARANAFAGTAEAVEVAPTTTNRLRYALALAVPGHAGSDTDAAEQQLSALLADDTLLPEERVLVEIHLAEVSQRLALDTSAARLRQELAEARAEQETDDAARLEAALDENRRLREALDEATDKLEAITSIEQSIRERENDTEEP